MQLISSSLLKRLFNRLKFLFKLAIIAISAIAFFVFGLNLYLRLSSNELIYSSAECPTAQYGVVFGTSPYVRGGDANPHYWGRINLAAKLYKEKKIHTLIVSGDNLLDNYNEPKAMRKDLQKLGVNQEDMLIDPLGLSTIETVKRSKFFYDSDEKVIFITQDYHLPRALLIAKSLEINAVGCKAQAPVGFSFWFVYAREVLARVKTAVEISIEKFRNWTS